MVLLQWTHWGIADNDVYVGKNQVAYAEDLDIRNPEYVTLGTKPSSVFTHGDDLVLCMTANFFWTHNGDFYKDDGTNLGTCSSGYSIHNIVTGADWYYYFSHWGSLWRISFVDSLLGTRTAQASYTESHDTDPMYNSVRDWAEFYYGSWNTVRNISAWAVTDKITSVYNIVGIRRTPNSFKCLDARGNYYYFDGNQAVPLALDAMGWLFMKGFYAEWLEGWISWHSPEIAKLFTLWANKQLLASARLATPDDKKAFYFGRADDLDVDYSPSTDSIMYGDQTVVGVNGMIYFIGANGIITYWANHVWMPKAWSVDITKNYNNAVVDEIGMVNIVTNSTTGAMELYFSWRIWTTGWVDKIDLTDITPTYKDSGVFYSPKYVFGDKPAKLSHLKCRAYTTAWATITVSISEDGWAFSQVDVLDSTDPKAYHLIDKHYKCYEAQFKFELETDDDSVTPIFRSFSFEPDIDG